jgi:hypothetical protein
MTKRTVTVEVTLSPSELALEFANMNNEQQARFFNELAKITDEWEIPFCLQLQAVIDSESLTLQGRRIMEAIGKYGCDDLDV